MTDSNLIQNIRAASRLIVRELGFMQTTLAATNYSASAVHTLLEVASHHAMSAAQLAPVLGLEKSTVSRMLGKLITAGELAELPSAQDARVKRLVLTKQGEASVARINAYASMQVEQALAQLNQEQQQALALGLSAYARALQARREHSPALPEIVITTGYQPGLIGRIAEMHGSYYAHQHGFGHFFEGKVASGLAEFSGRLTSPRNQIWVASQQGRIVGSVAIDGEDLGENQAHLRWFILDDGCRGAGVGRQLLSAAMAFCDEQAFAAVQLWTFKGLDAARRLYESVGFSLTNEWQGDQWGKSLREQQFTRPATAR